MKNSRIVFICAAMLICVTLISWVVNILTEGAILIKQGWATDLICDILSVYIVFTSKVKNKTGLFILGLAIYILVGVTLATLATFGLVIAP